MTPYNLVNMAKFLGFDMIALTDHNSCLNCKAAVEAGEQVGLTVVPGMELCTVEEAHVVCLFPTVEDAMGFHHYVQENTVSIPNDPEIFGKQVIMDAIDQMLGEEPCLLINASNISVSHVAELVRQFHGAAFPAHIDKSAYSVIASLGVVPEDAGFSAVEISHSGDISLLKKTNPEINDKILLRNSDAHYLEHMEDPLAWLELPEATAEALIEALNGEVFVEWG
jgi:PHP family Zn ribbon phosphoesterase